MKKYIAVYRPYYIIGGDYTKAFDTYFDAADWLNLQPPGTKTIITWYP